MDANRKETHLCKHRVDGVFQYARWAAAHDLGYRVRYCVNPFACEKCEPLDAADPLGKRILRAGAGDGHICGVHARLAKEYRAWLAAGRPDGYESANAAEYWSHLYKHAYDRDAFWTDLEKETRPLRAANVDVFGADYREALGKAIEKFLPPLR